jgi:crotonobetainyl-CoA:carnitine CoA-transferase CaiB-like acyl-CoA transferase
MPPALPLELHGKRLPKRMDPPEVGEHGRSLLAGLGYGEREIAELESQGVIALP